MLSADPSHHSLSGGGNRSKIDARSSAANQSTLLQQHDTAHRQGSFQNLANAFRGTGTSRAESSLFNGSPTYSSRAALECPEPVNTLHGAKTAANPSDLSRQPPSQHASTNLHTDDDHDCHKLAPKQTPSNNNPPSKASICQPTQCNYDHLNHNTHPNITSLPTPIDSIAVHPEQQQNHTPTKLDIDKTSVHSNHSLPAVAASKQTPSTHTSTDKSNHADSSVSKPTHTLIITHGNPGPALPLQTSTTNTNTSLPPLTTENYEIDPPSKGPRTCNSLLEPAQHHNTSVFIPQPPVQTIIPAAVRQESKPSSQVGTLALNAVTKHIAQGEGQKGHATGSLLPNDGSRQEVFAHLASTGTQLYTTINNKNNINSIYHNTATCTNKFTNTRNDQTSTNSPKIPTHARYADNAYGAESRETSHYHHCANLGPSSGLTQLGPAAVGDAIGQASPSVTHSKKRKVAASNNDRNQRPEAQSAARRTDKDDQPGRPLDHSSPPVSEPNKLMKATEVLLYAATLLGDTNQHVTAESQSHPCNIDQAAPTTDTSMTIGQHQRRHQQRQQEGRRRRPQQQDRREKGNKAPGPRTLAAVAATVPETIEHHPGGPAPGSGTLTQPKDVDVLCGRGGLINKHPGNIVYRKVVDFNKPYYQSVHKKHRILVSQSIVQTILNFGGRFLILGTKGKAWMEIDYRKAVQKTSQALRERNSSQDDEHNSISDMEEDDDDGDDDEDSYDTHHSSNAGQRNLVTNGAEAAAAAVKRILL